MLRGALNEALFLDNSPQMFFLLAKIRPFLPQARTDFDAPEYLVNIEKLAQRSPEGRERLRRSEEAVAKWGPEVRAKLKTAKAA